VNSFKDYFEANSPTEARAAALKTLIGTEASTIKGQFRLLVGVIVQKVLRFSADYGRYRQESLVTPSQALNL